MVVASQTFVWKHVLSGGRISIGIFDIFPSLDLSGAWDLVCFLIGSYEIEDLNDVLQLKLPKKLTVKAKNNALKPEILCSE